MPDPEGSSSDSSVKAYAFSTKPSSVRGPETVVHPSRSPASAQDSEHAQFESSTWRRLFPVETDAESPSDSQAPAGCELEHFLIEERIGVGGMGAVFRALDRRLDRVVALKVLSPTQAQYEGTLQRFQNEARAAARLDHDNIARVFYIGEDRGLQFIAYEFVTGTNIRDLIRSRGRLDPAQAVNYTLQIATALNHTFSAGVVHRDIKPSNIIIGPSGRAKLVDLGLARKQLTAESQELTTAGTTLGTFDYIAPEQAKDPRTVDVRSDIYSLGCTLYHMLTGEPPYPHGTMLQKLLDHQGKATPDPAAKNPNVSPELAAICRKMMASEPDRRYSTPDELMRDLAVVATSMGLRGVNPEGLVWTHSRIAQRPAWERYAGLIATTAILFAVVMVLTFFPGIRHQAKQVSSAGESTTPAGQQWPEPKLASRSPDSQRAPAEDPTAAMPAVDEEVLETASDDAAQDSADSPLSPGSVAAGGSRDRQETGSGRSPAAPSLEPIVKMTENLIKPLNEILLRQPVVAPRPDDVNDAEVAVIRPGRSSSGGASVSPTPLPFETQPVRPPQISILSKNGSEPKVYDTLEAACADAGDNSIIELKFNGSRGIKERPIRIANKRVTIRGAKGYRPLVEFEPLMLPDQQPITRMISVNHGSVELNNLDIHLEVRDEIATDLWAVFSAIGMDEVRIKRTIVSIDNPNGQPATLFELTDGPSRAIDMDMMDETHASADAEFRLVLSESIVRGSGSLVWVREPSPGRIEINQALIALVDALLEVGGSRGMSRTNADLELQIEHATCVLGRGLLELHGGDEPGDSLQVQVIARSNVFTSPYGAALVSMRGDLELRDFQDLLSWSGYDNFFEQFETFWRIEPVRSLAGSSKFDYEQWKSYWGMASTGGALGTNFFVRGVPDTRLVEIEPDDVVLIEDESINPAAGAAPDGTDAGADLARLPVPGDESDSP